MSFAWMEARSDATFQGGEILVETPSGDGLSASRTVFMIGSGTSLGLTRPGEFRKELFNLLRRNELGARNYKEAFHIRAGLYPQY